MQSLCGSPLGSDELRFKKGSFIHDFFEFKETSFHHLSSDVGVDSIGSNNPLILVFFILEFQDSLIKVDIINRFSEMHLNFFITSNVVHHDVVEELPVQ